jgi:diadenosine tetraphosphate (Ap4A) HIT family hydrolase
LSRSSCSSQGQRLCRAVEVGLGVHGSFVAINNKVSQSVPHLHVHVAPRRFGRLRGFFWPRQSTRAAHMDVRARSQTRWPVAAAGRLPDLTVRSDGLPRRAGSLGRYDSRFR